MSLLEEALLLQRAAHDLMYLGMDGSPIYSDDLSRRNSEVYRLATTLYNSGTWGTTVEEQANVCLALLKGYSASFIDHGEKLQHVQEVLKRCWDILDILPASLLKLRLLTACYGEVFDEALVDEALDCSIVFGISDKLYSNHCFVFSSPIASDKRELFIFTE